MSRRKNLPTTFGAAISDILELSHVPHYKFYVAIGIGKSYFYEILTEQAPEPEVLERILDIFDVILPPDPKRRPYILDQAAKAKKEIPPDIYECIRDNPDKWDKIRKLLEKHV